MQEIKLLVRVEMYLSSMHPQEDTMQCCTLVPLCTAARLNKCGIQLHAQIRRASHSKLNSRTRFGHYLKAFVRVVHLNVRLG